MARPAPAQRLSPTLVRLSKGQAAPAGETERIGITTRLTPEVHERLRRVAFDMREAKGKVIERAIVAFLDRRDT